MSVFSRVLGTVGALSATLQKIKLTGAVLDGGSVVQTLQSPTYSTSITPDLSAGTIITIVVTNNTAFTINAPLNPVLGEEMILVIRNTSGGAMGAITFNAVFKLPTFTNPATGFQRSMHFYYDGTNWREVLRGTDTPN